MRTTDEQRPGAALEVVLGVDTHLDAHVAVALDHFGRRLGVATLPTTEKGYEELVSWAQGLGPVRCAGVEGTSSYGAGLARHLKSKGIEVLQVDRPKRRQRSTSRRSGKSDHVDAEAAARIVLAGEAAGVPKSGDGEVEMIRVLRAARRAAVKARTQAANQLRNLGGDRSRGAQETPARTLHESAGRYGRQLEARRPSEQPRGGDEVRAPIGG